MSTVLTVFGMLCLMFVWVRFYNARARRRLSRLMDGSPELSTGRVKTWFGEFQDIRRCGDVFVSVDHGRDCEVIVSPARALAIALKAS